MRDSCRGDGGVAVLVMRGAVCVVTLVVMVLVVLALRIHYTLHYTIHMSSNYLINTRLVFQSLPRFSSC